MKPISPELKALLMTRQFWTCDLYTVTILQAGAASIVQRYTTGPIAITANGFSYPVNTVGPFFDTKDNKQKAHWKAGLEVDSRTVIMLPGAATIQGIPYSTAIRQGLFDGAQVTIHRAYMPLGLDANNKPVYGDTSRGTITIFSGRMAEIDVSGSMVTETLNSNTELLNIEMPRNLYQSNCTNTLYDIGCGLNRADFAVSGTIATGSTGTILNSTLAAATGYFDLGAILITSGANANISRSIHSYVHGSPGTITLMSPFPNPPANGDAFTIWPGCDKTQASCSAKFNNLARFRGFPFIPQVETAV